MTTVGTGFTLTGGTVPVLVAECPASDINGQQYTLVNDGGTTIWLGGPTVVSGSGFPLPPWASPSYGQPLSITLGPGEQVYAVLAAAGTSDVHVLGITGSR